jgi:pyrimidine deaminase RibD-like protein/NTP pyrophosphatase (non-canonical NTP hydrolase)
MHANDEREHMSLALALAAACVAEDDRARPKVGAVLVHQGNVLASAYRGEVESGEHAEFTLLERKLPGVDVKGATVFTTLEPCTTRDHPKVPCAARLVNRGIRRVVIGQLDPNPLIRGEGLLTLREAQVDVGLFPSDLMRELEELNSGFIREYRTRGNPAPDVTPQFLSLISSRQLDEWYRRLNATYWNRNYQRSPSEVFAHLYEIVGGLSTIASDKHKAGIEPQAYIAKALAWWMALCGKVGIRSIEAMIWDKFPDVCPYCRLRPHDPDVCTEMKEASNGVDWTGLQELGEANVRPIRLRDWQRMFSSIYPAQQTEAYGPSFARLNEELGELAEAIRVFNAVPGYFLSEAADVFAWLMHIQNLIESKSRTRFEDRGRALEDSFARAYPDGCQECGQRVCACPPILASTIGRIAHEVPKLRGAFGAGGRFLTSEEASRLFRPKA